MSTIFILISCMAVVKMVIEAAQRASMWVRLCHGFLYGLFIVGMHPVALSVSKVTVDAYLSSPARLGDLALLALLDLSLTSASLTSAEVRWPNARRLRYYGFLASVRDGLHKCSLFVPTVLAFPALFYFRLTLLFNLPGVSFWGVTLGMAALVILLTLFGPRICHWLFLQGKEALTLSLFIFAVAVVANVYAPESRVLVRAHRDTVSELQHAGLLLLGFLSMAIVGYFINRWRVARGARGD